MGDFDLDTAVEGADGRYRATLSPDWEIWGPNGGYLSTVLLRAAGAHTACSRPVSITVHYLAVASFGPLDLSVATLRRGRRTESMRVSATQGDRLVAEAMVWTADAADGGLAHDTASPPDVSDPDELPSSRELRGDDAPRFVFWENFDQRPLSWVDDWDAREAGDAYLAGWYRFVPRGTFEDPFVDAGRCVVLADTLMWPAALQAHSGAMRHMAPSLDVHVQFLRPAAGSEWLLAEAESPVGDGGLIGGTARVWSRDRRLLATATGQMLCRPLT